MELLINHVGKICRGGMGTHRLQPATQGWYFGFARTQWRGKVNFDEYPRNHHASHRRLGLMEMYTTSFTTSESAK